MLAINPKIKQKAEDIRKKIFGSEVRESLASGIEAISEDVEATIGRQDYVEEQFQNVIDETTDKDVISAPELIAARNGKSNLKTRLDEEHAQVTAQLQQTEQELNAQLAQSIKYVNYDMFGVNSEKKYYNHLNNRYYLDPDLTVEYTVDDGVRIKQCHEYANENNLPVINVSGDYVLNEPLDIEIKTSVDWGDTIFHVNESNSDNINHYFKIKSYNDWFEIKNISQSSILPFLKQGSRQITPLQDYSNHFVLIENENERVGKRHGTDSGRRKKDFFVVNNGGKLNTDVMWDFREVTKITAIKLPNSILTIRKGSFYLSGNLTHTDTNLYLNGLFKIERSRVKMVEQTIDFETGVSDTSSNASAGIYESTMCYDVTLEDITLPPRKSVEHGTYSIGGSYVLKFTLTNVSSNASGGYWGTMGTNLIKDLLIENSELNRIDTHFQLWNCKIKNSYVGLAGINIQGGGLLEVENVWVENIRYIAFRPDHGSSWNGDIFIKGGGLINGGVSSHNSDVTVLYFKPNNPNGDYGYPIVFGKKIIVRDFTFDFTNVVTPAKALCFIFGEEVNTVNGVPIQLPDYIEYKNIFSKDNLKGLELFSVDKLLNFRGVESSHHKTTEGRITTVDTKTNAHYVFENIFTTFKDVDVEGRYNNLIRSTLGVKHSHSLIPKIELKNINNIRMNLDTTHELFVTNCEINSIFKNSFDLADTNVKQTFINSVFNPVVLNRIDKQAYRVLNNHLQTFGCFIKPVVVSGNLDLEKTVTVHGLLTKPFNFIRVHGRNYGMLVDNRIVDYMTSTYGETAANEVLKELNNTTKLNNINYVEYEV